MSRATPSPGPARLDARLEPHASRELGAMFDEVSLRYDLLNRLMTLGRDMAWRRAMWREVPEDARVVLDLCTGNGASLTGLRRPGRLVLGLDVSPKMLDRAAESIRPGGWAPRLVCADAFDLPLPDRSVDCVTVAFGLRNLRPLGTALAEIARVLEPGGTLVALEATGPRPSPIAPLHDFYLRRVIPLLGRLSSEPSAYAYLSRSIREFGPGTGLERDLAGAGYQGIERRSFMLGAAGLWVARRPGARLEPPVHDASLGQFPRGEMRSRSRPGESEWRWWNGLMLALSALLAGGFGYALWVFQGSGAGAPWEPWQRRAMLILLVVGLAGFVIRSLVLWLRLLGPPPRR